MTRLNAIQVTVSKHHECLTVYITVSVVLDSYLKNLNKSRSTQNVVVKQMSMTLALFKWLCKTAFLCIMHVEQS